MRVFMLDPERAYYQRQLEAATGFAIRAVQRELDRLAGVGLLYRRAEGNRTYYRVDTSFPLFPELRAMVLKTSGAVERLRGALAMDDSVQQAFLCEDESRVLVITRAGRRPRLTERPSGFTIEAMSADSFARALADAPETLESFLGRGVDLLGRRDDVLWRRIEAANFIVSKGKGVA